MHTICIFTNVSIHMLSSFFSAKDKRVEKPKCEKLPQVSVSYTIHYRREPNEMSLCFYFNLNIKLLIYFEWGPWGKILRVNIMFHANTPGKKNQTARICENVWLFCFVKLSKRDRRRHWTVCLFVYLFVSLFLCLFRWSPVKETRQTHIRG